MKTKTIDARIRELMNKKKTIVCDRDSYQSFMENKQNYIGIRMDGMYYHYSPKSKTQQTKIKYYSNFKYEG